MPFFEAASRGELLLQRCRACGAYMWPVRARCVECFAGEPVWSRASGTGRIYTFSVVHQVAHPAFAEEVPYNIVTVELDEGVRIISRLIDGNDRLAINLPVAVTFRVVDGLSVPYFVAEG
jgi:uncharacterized OB-fold protein